MYRIKRFNLQKAYFERRILRLFSLFVLPYPKPTMMSITTDSKQNNGIDIDIKHEKLHYIYVYFDDTVHIISTISISNLE